MPYRPVTTREYLHYLAAQAAPLCVIAHPGTPYPYVIFAPQPWNSTALGQDKLEPIIRLAEFRRRNGSRQYRLPFPFGRFYLFIETPKAQPVAHLFEFMKGAMMAHAALVPQSQLRICPACSQYLDPFAKFVSCDECQRRSTAHALARL